MCTKRMKPDAPLLLLLVVTLFLLGSATLGGVNNGRTLLVDVAEKPLAWADEDLGRRLTTRLSQSFDLRIATSEMLGSDQPSFPDNRIDTDQLSAWGVEAGGHYLLVVTVDDEGLERKRTFHVPLLFHRYQTLAVIRGDLRLIDVHRGRVLFAEPFDLKIKAAQQFQAEMDDNIGDPALHVRATEKSRVFAELEEKLVDHIEKRLSRELRGR